MPAPARAATAMGRSAARGRQRAAVAGGGATPRAAGGGRTESRETGRLAPSLELCYGAHRQTAQDIYAAQRDQGAASARTAAGSARAAPPRSLGEVPIQDRYNHEVWRRRDRGGSKGTTFVAELSLEYPNDLSQGL